MSAYPFNALHNASHYSNPGYTKNALDAWEIANSTGGNAVSQYKDLSEDLLSSLFLIEIGVIDYQWVHSSRLSGVSYTKRWELDVTNAYLS